MTDDPKLNLVRAFRLMLRPLVRILLRGGVTWKEAAEACKATFVEVATQDYGLHGRPTNASRVAILTGLSRREVARLRKELAAEQEPEFGGMNSATRLLTGWHIDADFLDASGRPLELPMSGAGASFESLARRYGGDIAAVTLVRELTRTGAVVEQPNGSLRAMKRYFMPSPLDPAAVLRAGSVLQDLGNTVGHNLGCAGGEVTSFEGRATNERMVVGDEKAFRAFLEREGQAFLERVDDWLAMHEATAAEEKKYRLRRFGVGVYQIKDEAGDRSTDEN
ncbi:MAG: DUF6502 family protein [Gammaproteobacteria bacterium]|nr:DUF6502 family protein [Gammaproteobacteria bacterium]